MNLHLSDYEAEVLQEVLCWIRFKDQDKSKVIDRLMKLIEDNQYARKEL